jgi:hypothetical protein
MVLKPFREVIVELWEPGAVVVNVRQYLSRGDALPLK